MLKYFLIGLFSGVISSSYSQIEHIKLPAGFRISEFAMVPKARSLCQSPTGTIFVGSRQGNQIYALQDLDKDGVAEKKFIVAKGLNNMPNGVAFKDGNLYIAEVNRVLLLRDIENQLLNPPKPEVFFDGYPSDTHHGWKYIAFGPDGWLYVPVGAPCNICLSENPVYASITRLSPDGKKMEIIASGIRNTVGFTWHPTTGELWFTDNGRDMMGDDMPPDELNRLEKPNQHFGYPFCHGGTLPDPEFGSTLPCSTFTAPVQNLGPHVASLGLKFSTSKMFPKEYDRNILIAEHGSWNRTNPIGYRITRVQLKGNESIGYSNFITGWLDEEGKVTGRPVDLLFIEDGSMLISDDFAGLIYRVSYER